MKIARIVLVLMLVSRCCLAQHWQSMGSGLDWYTTKLYEDTVSDQLFVGGAFGFANSQIVRSTATWNGFAWGPLGVGTNVCPWGSGGGYNVWAIVRYGGYIYFGGNFDCVANLDNTKSFARWSGSAWDSVPGGKIPSSGGVVDDLIVNNNELYVCGTFNTIGSLSANGIAKWDGTIWSTVGNNYNFVNQGHVGKMAFYHGNLYVGGTFLDPQGNVCRLAKWDGNSWQFFTSTPSGGLAQVSDLKVYNDELYVSGEFYYGGGNPGTAIMRWNDTTWRDVGGSVQMGVFNQYPTVRQMCVYDGKLYCVGNFERIGGVDALGLASWDGNQWCGYDSHFDYSGPNDFVGATNIAFFRDTMYVGGGFQYMDTMQVNYIARWVGGNFVDTCGTAVGVFENLMFINRVLVYPNPASEIITFGFSDSPQSRSLIIYDQLGREILREETNENMISLSVESFAEGMYFYKVIQDGSSSATGKFIVTH